MKRKEGDRLLGKGKKHKGRQQGFSLIEVLVSIVILSIVMIPLFNNLLLASRTNLKSYQIQNATTVVQNIADGIKNVSMDEVAAQIIYNEDGKALECLDLYSIRGSQSKELLNRDGLFIDAPTPCVSSNAERTEFTFTEREGRTYYFGIEGLEDGNQAYDVLLTYNADTYSNATEDLIPGISVEEGINDVDIPIIADIAQQTNAIISQGYRDTWAESTLLHNYNQWFADYYMYQYGSMHVPSSEKNEMDNEKIRNHMSRHFEVYITFNILTRRYDVKASLTYQLEKSILTGLSSTMNDYYNIKKFDEYKDEDVFHGTFEKLENIYLFFSPNLPKQSDTLTIYNKLNNAQYEDNYAKTKKDISVYLVQQNQSSVAGYAESIRNYKMKVNLEEMDLAYVDSKGSKQYRTTIRNNFRDGAQVVYAYAATPNNQKDFIEVEKDKTRLYHVKIEVFLAQESSRYNSKDLLATFETSGGR